MRGDGKGAALLRILAGSAAVSAPCPHVADGCGGCMLQQYEYESQLAAKRASLSQLYGTPVHVVACRDPLGYRNRMDFVAAFGKMGLRQRGNHTRVVDIRDCLLLPPHARKAYATARTLLHDVDGYDYIRHQGFLRYLVIRTSRTTEELLLIVTTTSPAREDEFKALLERMREATGAAGVVWALNDSKTDTSVGEPYWCAGRPWITDEVAGLEFRVGPKTFFQANTLLAGDLFMKAVSYARGTVLDLYCGVGVIGCIAERQEEVGDVVGVDLVPESIEAARENAMINGITRCRFVCADAAAYLAATGERFDTVICDPARPGLGKKACALLLDLAPRRIIYISCNPLSHKEDLALLSQQYETVLLEGYDLFPQTPHVEVLSVLERK